MRTLRPGDTLGPYRVIEVVGAGGMGIVYRAEHVRLERSVALKVLPPELARDQTFRERFVREAKLAASIEHRGILTVYDAGEDDGLLFVAMRYVAGTDLREVVRREGRLDPERALGIVEQVAEALDAAHERGLVHRDVKPANILVARPERHGPEPAFLADFGVARHAESERLTRTGEFLGSVDYSAPELFGRGPIDGRADQYSLACVAYECLTGDVPFPRETSHAAMRAHLEDPAPLASRARPTLPPGIDVALARAMAKRPEDRFETCGELASALRVAIEGRPATVEAPAAPRAATRDGRGSTPDLREDPTERVAARRRARPALAAVALVVLGGLAIAGALLLRGEPARPVPSPEIAFASDREGDLRLFVVDASGGEPRPLGSPAQVGGAPAWSPDGRRVAFERQDGAGDAEIWIMDADGTDARALTDNDVDDRAPAWSPDGERLAVQRSGGSFFEGDAEIWVVEVGGGERQLTDNGENDLAPTWSPDGERIAFAHAGAGFLQDADIYAIPADGGGEAEALVEGGGDDFAPAWSPDGSRVAFETNVGGLFADWNISVVTLEDGDIAEVTADGAHDHHPSWSPDGTRLAFERTSGALGDTEIFVIGLDGTGLRAITDDGADDRAPAWGPPRPGFQLVPSS